MTTLFAFLFAVIVVVAVHEWGHFFVARRLGILVQQFSIGMGPTLWSKTKQGIEYRLAWLPLGGYVLFTDARHHRVSQQQQPYLFEQQSLWKKAAVVVAGPTINFVLAYVLMVVVLIVGLPSPKAWVAPGAVGTPWAAVSGDEIWQIERINQVEIQQFEQLPIVLLRELSQYHMLSFQLQNWQGEHKDVVVDATPWRALAWQAPQQQLADWGLCLTLPPFPAVIANVEANSAAAQAGLQKDDQVIAVNGMRVESFAELSQWIRVHPNESVRLQIQRHQQLLDIPLVIGAQTTETGAKVGFLGIRPVIPEIFNDRWLSSGRLTVYEAITQAPQKLFDLTLLTLQAVGRLISGQSGLEQLSGPIGIAQAAGNSLDQGWLRFLQFLSLLSLSLGVLNLLPLPLLDGGHLVLYAVEGWRGRQFSDQFMWLWQKVGMVMIAMLTLLAISSDINRLFGG